MATPTKVILTDHARRRIKKRGLDKQQILNLMRELPYVDGTFHWTEPETNTRIVFTDELLTRTIITAMSRERKVSQCQNA